MMCKEVLLTGTTLKALEQLCGSAVAKCGFHCGLAPLPRLKRASLDIELGFIC